MFHKIGIFQLPMDSALEICGGVIEIRHIYASGEPVSLERWHTDAKYKTRITQIMPWDFSFSSGHRIGTGGWNGFIRPNYYWQLRIPLLLLPVLLLFWASLARPWSNNLYGPKTQSV